MWLVSNSESPSAKVSVYNKYHTSTLEWCLQTNTVTKLCLEVLLMRGMPYEEPPRHVHTTVVTSLNFNGKGFPYRVC